MFVPVMLILVLVAIRSTFMVFAYSLPKYQHLLRIISGITGLLIPALLITVLPVTEGAYITMSEGKKYSYMENFFLVLLFIVICSSD